MSTEGKESRSSTLSDLILAFEEEKNREYEEKIASELCSDSESVESFKDENFPSLNSRVMKSSSVPKTFNYGKIDNKNKKNDNSLKAYICKSIEESIPCPYGRKCKFAHNAVELETKKCTYGDDCNRIKIKKGIVFNVDQKNPCIFTHPSETLTSFVDRKGITGLPLESIKDSQEYKYTRMCVSYINGIKCLKGTECTYAHTVNELKATKCNFGKNCNNVSKCNNLFSNKGDKMCVFLHPEESLDNYYNRALKNQKKPEILIAEKIEESESEDDDDELQDEESEEDEDEDEEDEEEEDEEDEEDDEERKSESITFLNVKNNVDEEDEILILILPKNKVGKLCEVILSAGIKNLRITKQ